MDLKCNCINCQEIPRERPANFEDFTTKDSTNKRYETQVNTSELYRTLNIPERFEHSYLLKGYGNQQKDYHPIYRTTNSEYGWMPPNEHTVPHRYYPRSNEFSTLLSKSGMYRNYSLNTVMDKSHI